MSVKNILYADHPFSTRAWCLCRMFLRSPLLSFELEESDGFGAVFEFAVDYVVLAVWPGLRRYERCSTQSYIGTTGPKTFMAHEGQPSFLIPIFFHSR